MSYRYKQDFILPAGEVPMVVDSAKSMIYLDDASTDAVEVSVDGREWNRLPVKRGFNLTAQVDQLWLRTTHSSDVTVSFATGNIAFFDYSLELASAGVALSVQTASGSPVGVYTESGDELQVQTKAGTALRTDTGQAHDAAASTGLWQVGGYAATNEPAQVADGDYARQLMSRTGKALVDSSLPADRTKGTLTGHTGTGDSAVIAAPGAGYSLEITSIHLSETGSAAGVVIIKSGTTEVHRCNIGADSDRDLNFNEPLRLATNEALNITLASAGATVNALAVGRVAR